MARCPSGITTPFLLIFAAWFLGACTVPDGPASAPVPEAPSDSPTAARSITIETLGLSFQLPPPFEVIEHEDFLFLARSDEPRGVFSIEPEMPDVIEHEPEGEESVETTEIDGVDAMIVTDAVLEGLPPGVAARELLVANGDRSFSLIMSAAEEELPSLWEEFINSVAIEPD